MRPRVRSRYAIAVVFLVACGRGAQSGGGDAGTDGSDEPETVPPKLVAVEPEGEMWLHEPVRFVFDEPVTIEQATATATFAGSPVGATLAMATDHVVTVTMPPTLRGVGVIEVTVSGAILDRWGNRTEGPFVAQLSAPAWSRPAIDRGLASESPAIAIHGGELFAAWIVDGQVMANRYAGKWEAGDPLGSGASAVSVSFDEAGSPLVAWIEAGVAHVARWQPNGWATLPSPGGGSRVVLAGTSVAVFGAAVQLRALSKSDTWEVVADYAMNGPLVGEPAFIGTAVAWIERAGTAAQIRVVNDGTTMSSIPVDDSQRVSLASNGSTLAIAFDELGGSWNVVAALANGNGWTRLGRMLDVDASGNATMPAIAIDSMNRPIVAWRERIETNERGVVARWSGSAWTPIGNSQWHTVGVPSAPAMVLRDDTPAIASITNNALELARYNGRDGSGPTRQSISGCSVDPNNPPSTLFATGCFSAGAAPHAGLVPYDIINELWTDGTKKRRWIGLPNGTTMSQGGNDAWVAPVGTIVAKEFAIETTPGNPATRKPVETRLLVNTSSGWLGFSYQWRDNGSNADLLNDGTYTKDWPLDAGGSYRHLYPSRSQCLSCHHTSYGPLLGIRPQQLQRWFDYDGVIADQAATLATLGIGPAPSGAPFISTHDRGVSWEQRSRSYMAANCAHCHNPNNIAIKDLRYTTPLAQTRLCEVITPGYPDNSVVYARVTQRPGMPPLGTLITDPLPQQLLYKWISGMTSCP